jgi:hypothetical protein
MSYYFQSFSYPSLSNYKFSVYDLNYPEQICGYDEQQRSWRGEELLAMREQALIIKECPEKIVIVGEKKSLLGYIRECFDCTWLAHSCYYYGDIDIVEVNGFNNEFNESTAGWKNIILKEVGDEAKTCDKFFELLELFKQRFPITKHRVFLNSNHKRTGAIV